MNLQDLTLEDLQPSQFYISREKQAAVAADPTRDPGL